jgi:TorA maturation chaperone TorD
MLSILRDPEIAHTLEALAPGCSGYLDQHWDRDTFDQCAADFCGLFILSGGAPPYAGAWVEGDAATVRPALFDRITEVANALGQASADESVPPDHIAVLLTLVVQAEEADEVDADLIWRVLLGEWVGAFTSTLEARTNNPLYLATARLLHALAASYRA